MKLQIIVSYHNERWQARIKKLFPNEAKKSRIKLKSQNKQFLEYELPETPKEIIDYVEKNEISNRQPIMLNSKKKKNYLISEIILNSIYQKYEKNIPYLAKVCQSIDGIIFGESSLITILENIHNERATKEEAHKVFDAIWKKGYMKRSEAYWWLSRKMNIEKLYCHISLFSSKECREVVRHVEHYFKENEINLLEVI